MKKGISKFQKGCLESTGASNMYHGEGFFQEISGSTQLSNLSFYTSSFAVSLTMSEVSLLVLRRHEKRTKDHLHLSFVVVGISKWEESNDLLITLEALSLNLHLVGPCWLAVPNDFYNTPSVCSTFILSTRVCKVMCFLSTNVVGVYFYSYYFLMRTTVHLVSDDFLNPSDEWSRSYDAATPFLRIKMA